jgi:uncharacterized protein with PIN domain
MAVMNKPKPKPKPKTPRCERCKTTEKVTYGTDAYSVEIYGDYTKSYLCEECRNLLAEEV